MGNDTFEIIDSDGDFSMVQNYVIQLCSEKIITAKDFLLYSFYRSISGFKEIRPSYDYISLNTGISKGAISAGNSRLGETGLIKIKKNGVNKTFQIFLQPGSSLPRRQLKCLNRVVGGVCEEEKHQYSGEVRKFKQKPQFDPDEAQQKFINKFIKYWCKQNGVETYPKNDFAKVLEIDCAQAIKYIPVLWSLGEADIWVGKSDYSISIFVKEYKNGRIQAFYPKTRQYHIDKSKEQE